MNTILSHETVLDCRYQGQYHTFHIGDEFGQLTIKELVRYREGSGAARKGCICECSCGSVVGLIRFVSLLNGDTVSCGCVCRDIHSKLMTQQNFKHGQSFRGKRSKLYGVWAAMLDRARNLNRPDAVYYAGKLGDQAIDQDWLDFEKFSTWAMSHGYQDGLSIDRIKNELGYGPGNCRFIDVHDQNKNKTSNRLITYDGETKTITDWSRVTGLSWSVLDRRLKKGLSVGQVLGFE